MKTYNTDEIKNIALLGSKGSGKTTLAEAMLFECGVIKRRGTVEANNTVSDYFPVEKEYGYSVFSTVFYAEFLNKKLNVIDCPGADDFVGNAYTALGVCDTGVIVLDAEYGVDFVLANINKPQVVENIFYDFDKATLRPESKAALDEMVAMLRDNPNVSIEMGSHTDRHGSVAYNEGLSDRRAKAVIDYLTAAGIPQERLTWKGYGKSVPKTVTKRINSQFPQFPEGTVLNEEFIATLSEEDQAAADQINRRTEFKVTSIDRDMW